MHTYHFDNDPCNTHRLLLNLIPENSKVLEVGTASGYLGDYLIHEKHCELWGVEPVDLPYEAAAQVGYSRIFNETVEQTLASGALAREQFDRILLGDVLEHMPDPSTVLAHLAQLLAPNGRVVISLPNIAHYSIRWALLLGQWNMTGAGILDRTHLRFFTRKTVIAMIESAGYAVESIRPSNGALERFGKRKLFGVGKRLLFAWPTLFAVQWIIVAKKP